MEYAAESRKTMTKDTKPLKPTGIKKSNKHKFGRKINRLIVEISTMWITQKYSKYLKIDKAAIGVANGTSLKPTIANMSLQQ